MFPTDEVSISAPKPGEPTSTTADFTVATSLLAVDFYYSMEQSLVIQQLLVYNVWTVIAVCSSGSTQALKNG